MPNQAYNQAPYLYTGNPLTENNPVPYKLGEIGIHVDFAGIGACQEVFLDSGATAATPTGIVAAGQLAYWKNRSVYLVTNDVRVCEFPGESYNCVAGVFGTAVGATPGIPTNGQAPLPYGSECWVLQRGTYPSVKSDGTGAAGSLLYAAAAANGVSSTSNGVAVGVARGAAVSNAIAVDLNIPTIP